MFAYARTWRNTHYEQLKKFVARDGARIRVILPDYDDAPTVAELARRFNTTSDKIVEAIREAEGYFQKLQREHAANGAQVEVWLLPASMVFTFYLFSGRAVWAPYCHRKDRAPVPAIIASEGGSLYTFLQEEVHAVLAGKPPQNPPLGRKVTWEQ